MKSSTILALIVCILAAPVSAFEMRGLWVDAFHPGLRTPEEISEMVAKAKECNFNTLFVQARKRGNVYYKSEIEPMAPELKKDFDPLETVIATAHASGIQVHAWITVFDVYRDIEWNKANPRQVHLKHPEWLMKDDTGGMRFSGDRILLDPGVPEAREYLTAIVAEVARNYDVDGIHLDRVMYPGQEAGYNELSVARFSKETERADIPQKDDERWCNWRRAQLTEFMKRAGQAVKRARKDAKLSASVVPSLNDAYSQRFQDWEGWLRSGILDFAVPMVFQMDNGVFMSMAGQCLASTSDAHPIYIGQGGWQIPIKQSIEQIKLARKVGAPGVVIYSYAGCSKPPAGDKDSLMEALKKGPFSTSEQ